MRNANKNFNKGDIVYWCHQKGNEYSVRFGMVDEQFSDAVTGDYLSVKENRLINDIPIEDFPQDTKLKKLPKGWTYNTELFTITYDNITKEEREVLSETHINNPEEIKRAYELGVLVKDSTIFHGNIESEITKEGYRLVKKYPMWEHHISNFSIRPDKLYFTYEEAQKEVNANIAEFHRQASLSDYDWSIEQIDKTLNFWMKITGETEETKQKYRNWLLAMENVEDLEIRSFGKGIQWKYDKNKKWNNIIL